MAVNSIRRPAVGAKFKLEAVINWLVAGAPSKAEFA